jgi:hypothetical protein
VPSHGSADRRIAEDVGSVDAAGAVNVRHGSATGLIAAGDQFWHQEH